MDRKAIALFGMAVIAIAGMVMVSACTSTVTPSATPTVVPSATPTVSPSATPIANTSANITAAFNQSDNNRTVNVKNGDLFTITLTENPSTGYSWNASVTSGLSIVNSTYLPPGTDLLGAPGTHEWQIRATGTGNQTFSAVYKRPLEPIEGNETSFVLNVTVT